MVIVVTSALAYLIPDMPRKLREQVRREAYLANEIILKTELKIARGSKGGLSDNEMKGIRHRMKDLVLRSRVGNDAEGPVNNAPNAYDPIDESPV